MTKFNADPFKARMAAAIKWDPTDNQEGYKASCDGDAVEGIVWEYLKAHPKGAETVTAKDFHPDSMRAITSLLLVHGHVTPAEYLKIIADNERDVTGKFLFPMDKGEKFLEAAISSLAENHKLLGAEVPATGPLKLERMSAKLEAAVDGVFKAAKQPTWQQVVDGYMGGPSPTIMGMSEEQIKEQQSEMERVQGLLSDLMSKPRLPDTVEVVGDGSTPTGKTTTVKASTIFGADNVSQDFDVPFWEWDGPHPDVPAKDPNYIFRASELTRVLYALITNSRAYLQGHTGSGKTTLVEQVAAHLNWPFIRINFDSEITRMDLIGRDVLTTDSDGNTVSKFIDGILPRAMGSHYLCCFDEIDFARPDVAYVMQSALEGSGLRITEDGDRLVTPDPMFRMFATGNTVGQGDEHGMYQGARAQSLAFLDRFTVWIRVNYLDKGQRETLIKTKVPALGAKDLKALSQYVTEHLEAFTGGTVTQPISPRGMLGIAEATVIMGSLKEAMNMTILDRANEDDRATLKGLVDRVTK
jgi:cobaltochelatase CobS